MRFTALTCAAIACAASTAAATFEVTRSTSAYHVHSDATFNLDVDNGEFITDTQSLLDGAAPSISIASSSAVAPVSVGADASATDSLTHSATGYTLELAWSTQATASWPDIDNTFIDFQGLADIRNQTRFESTQQTLLSFEGLAALTSAVGDDTIDIPLLQIMIRSLHDAEVVYDYGDTPGDISESVLLDPGAYSVSIATTSLIEFEGFSSSDRFFLESASLDLTVTATAIPAPSAALLLPALAGVKRRRR